MYIVDSEVVMIICDGIRSLLIFTCNLLIRIGCLKTLRCHQKYADF